MISEQSSFDAEKAYDSTSKPLLDWSWQRIGVPKEVASWLAHMDVDGTTVIKKPFAEAVWALLLYRQQANTLRTLWRYLQSAVLSSFSAKRGMGQGDPPSSTWVGGEDNGVFANDSNRYVDDSLCGSHSAQVIQKKADLVSACCIILGIRLSSRKI